MVQTGTCPSCGQPVAASVGISAGDCPHCGQPIPLNPANNAGTAEPRQNAKIL